MSQIEIPTYRDLMWPTLVAIDELGGSAAVSEVDEKTIEIAGVTEEQLSVEFPSESAQTGSKVSHRIRWALSYLKNAAGAVDNSSRGVWAISDRGRELLKLSRIDAE